MADFYIKKLTVSGKNVRTAELNFQPGTNIVYGTSELGKSYIVECLDFMFGAKSMRLGSSSGYNELVMTVQRANGYEITITRYFDGRKNDVSIWTTDPELDFLSCANVNRDVLDAFWLRLIGVHENQTIVTDGHYTHKLLRWSNFKKSLLIKENRISRDQSIISGSTDSLSALLFLLTELAFADVPTEDSEADKRKINKGGKEQLLKQMGRIKNERLDLLTKMGGETVETYQAHVDELMERFQAEEQNLNQSLEKSQQLHSQLNAARKRLVSFNAQLENYKLLQSLYDAQLRRLAFSTEGQLQEYGHSTECRCPFCGNTADKSTVSDDALVASQAELEETEIAIQNFQTANDELKTQIEKQKKLISDLTKQCADLDEKISVCYAPTVNELRQKLTVYVNFAKLSEKYDVLGDEYKKLDEALSIINQESKEPENKFKPKDYIPDEFFVDMKDALSDMLTACEYGHFERVRLEKTTMDISIDHQDKSTFSEGYRAFLNSTLAFCLFRYLCNKGAHRPGILIMDSPIQAMKDKDGIELSKGLFEYITNNSACGQVIIIDNRLPDNANLKKANIYHLVEPGFLPDFKHPTKNRKETVAALAGEQLSMF